MPDAEASKLTKIMKMRKYFKVVNILKEFVSPMTITKHIQHLRVILTISKLLVSAQAIEKQLTKAITKNKTIQFCINTLIFNTVNTRNSYS